MSTVFFPSSPSGFAIVEDLTGAAVTNNVLGIPCSAYQIQIINTNTARVYLKLYDNVLPTLGTAAPNTVFPCDPNNQYDPFIVQIPKGIPFALGLSFAVLTTPGTAGTTFPTLPVITRITCK